MFSVATNSSIAWSKTPALQEPYMSAFPHPPLLFFRVHLSSTYCKQGWWDCGWKGLPVATDPITKPVFPVLRSTGCSKWCRKSKRESVYVFSAVMCAFEDTRSVCVYSIWLCVFQSLMGCWGPPLVQANFREQTTYYYWSPPGQNNNPVYSFLILVMDSAETPLIEFREGVRQRNSDENTEIQREILTSQHKDKEQ